MTQAEEVDDCKTILLSTELNSAVPTGSQAETQVWNFPHFHFKIPFMLSGFQVVWCLECRLCCGCVVVEAGGGVAQVWSLGGRGPQCLQSAVWRQSLVTTTPWARQHGPHYTTLLFGFSKYKTENILTI